MENIIQLIPSFSLWQTFNEMILTLTNTKHTESNVMKLQKVIQTEEILKQLVYNENANLSYEQTKTVNKIYKSFSLWILGRLYHLLGRPNLGSVYYFIIEVHMKILSYLSNDIYDDITREYVKILNMLVCYSEGTTVTLEVFVPEKIECGLDLSQVFVEISTTEVHNNIFKCNMKLLEFIICKNLKLFNLNDVVYDTVDCLIGILKESTLAQKLNVLELYVNILKEMELSEKTLNELLNKKIQMFPLYMEALLYEIYDKKMTISEQSLASFNEILKTLLNNFQNIPDSSDCIIRICMFLVEKYSGTPENENFVIDEAIGVLCQTSVHTDQVLDRDVEFLMKHFNLIKVYQCKIIVDINYYLKCPKLNEIIEVYDGCISNSFYNIHNLFFTILDNHNCNSSNCMKSLLTMLDCLIPLVINIKIKLQNYKLEQSLDKYILKFFDEDRFIETFFNYLNQHVHKFTSGTEFESILKLITEVPILLYNRNLEIWMFLILLPFFKRIKLNVIDLFSEERLTRKTMPAFKSISGQLNFTENESIKYACSFITILGSGLVDHDSNLTDLKTYFLKFMNYCLEENNAIATKTIVDHLPGIISFLQEVDHCTIKNMLSLTLSHAEDVKDALSLKLMQIVCILTCPYIQFIQMENGQVKITIMCLKCNYRNKFNTAHQIHKEYKTKEWQNFAVYGPYNNKRNDYFINVILKAYLQYLQVPNVNEVKLNAIKALKNISNHVLSFYGKDCQLWLNLVGHENKDVRLSVKNVVRYILSNILEIPQVANERGAVIKDKVFAYLIEKVKQSLEKSDTELQITLVDTIKEISKVKVECVQFPVMKLLLYFIMIPTSSYSWYTINVFTEFAELHDTRPANLYKKHQNDLCKHIINMCATNLMLIDWNLNQSLETVVTLFEYLNCNDFVNQNVHLLLTYLIRLIPKMPKCKKLVEEVSTITNTDLAELLTIKYDRVFVELYLNETETIYNQCENYIKTVTKVNGASLRKSNSNTILSELLLNYSEKRDRVFQALKLLISDECGSATLNNERIADYLQPKFLGVLQYFDMKLSSCDTSKLKVMMSLSDILKLMGPKRVTPLRFKIMAMLSALYLKYGKSPDLSCNVWNMFIRTCDIDALGPQLATIFISLLPLKVIHPKEIYTIFKYLLIENEKHFKENILDLFFVLDSGIENEFLIVIRKYVAEFEERSFKDQLKQLLKYLKHETTDVKIYAFKYLKKLLEKNRGELDRMILGYNGIDGVIIELIDILTLGCRVKDHSLKLACGECIGELGAIEPSHLPRRQNQQAQTFSFYITEDTFIVNSLNELIKALQAETQNMDRFSLAIQEILKLYDISPSENSSRNSLWKLFPESHQELMTPLLSSRYTMTQSVQPIKQFPIYGSNCGSSLQIWLNNWLASLITTLAKEKETLLQACLPSLKENHRLLMLFMPYVLLHSLIEGEEIDQENAYAEITAVVNSFNAKNSLNESIIEIKPLRSVNCANSRRYLASTSEEQIHCAKVVFILLDFLNRWVKEWEWQKGADGRRNISYNRIQKFLSRFCKLKLSKRNYDCGEYSRALLYIEDYFENYPDNLDNHLYYLAEIYAKLGECDGVAGVTAIRQKEPNLQEKILALEVSGKLVDAVSCYERMPHPMSINHLKGFVQCILDLDNVNTAYNLARKNDLFELQAEALWRLGKYEDLNDLLKKPELQKNQSWGVQMGHALLNFRSGKRDEFKLSLKELKVQQIRLFGSSSLEEGAYQHGYSCIAKLHSLNELEHIESVAHEMFAYSNDKMSCQVIMQKLVKELELRFKLVQKSIKIIEPILCIRRVAIDQAKSIVRDKSKHCASLLDSLLGKMWLSSAKAARISGLHQQAYSYTVKAEEYAPPSLFIEKAKLHWFRMENNEALTTLRKGIERYVPSISQQTTCSRNSTDASNLTLDERKLCAKAKLLIATYNAATSNVEATVNIEHYKEAVDMFKECEKSLVLLAQYYDKVFQSLPDDERDTKGSKIQLHMINYFGKSLLFGTRYIYQSMPRLLSIWFDYGTRVLDVNVESVRKERKTMLMEMTQRVHVFLERLPTFVFLTCFSQLVSRICHPQKEVYMELKAIIVKVMLSYPQQTLWMLIPIIKSSYAVRAKRCEEILLDSRLKTPVMAKLVSDFKNLAEKLIELCNKPVNDNAMVVSVNCLLRSLPRLIKAEGFNEIMIPTQIFRKIILPNPDFNADDQHNPFPNHYAHIIGIKDEMYILQSLQKPRRITLLGSDGKNYIQMLKPKDDLRKDFRLMEFNDIVNLLLCEDSESRQRRLNIRLYSVVPLNEECGMIEWVPNLVGLRPILCGIYQQRGKAMSTKEFKECLPHIKDGIAKKREIFINKFLPRHPPVLGDWFKKTFPDVQAWLTARTAYIRTTAVISMAGYILGLGDRHGENILLDATCGDTVHVDFNCLFNKGESFEWPERVPFRLTHNMVAAMGPLGVEGFFRISCACTLRVLRNNIDMLMSIVRPFVYDPLVSWPRISPNAISSHAAERTNEQAVEHIRNIEQRLQGMIKTRGRISSIPLSVEGQTDILIEEATSIDNLCQMYFGWGAYL